MNQLQTKAHIGILVGFDEMTKGYWCYNLEKCKVMISHDVMVDETTFMLHKYPKAPTIFIPNKVSISNPLKAEKFQQLSSMSTSQCMNQGHSMPILLPSSLDQYSKPTIDHDIIPT